MDGNTIDSMIKSVNQLYKVIHLRDSYQTTDEGLMEEHTLELPVLLTSRSTGGETMQEITPVTLPVTAISLPYLTNLSDPEPVNLIRKLQGTLSRLKRHQKYIKSLQSDVEAELNKQLAFLSKVVMEVEPSGTLHTSLSIWIRNDLEDVTKKLLGLMSKVRVPRDKQKKKPSPDYQDSDGGHRGIICLPGIHESDEELKRLPVFRYVLGEFMKLNNEMQICLLSLAVFPENQEVKRTMLMYWWIGEDLLPVQFIPEDAVKGILEVFVMRKLIEPVENKRKVEPNSYKMTPFVHSSVVLLSKEMGLFDMYRRGKKPKMRQSELNKVCLVEGSSSQAEAKDKKKFKAERIETVFNVSERYPDFIFKWFSMGNSMKVLYLGRWERSEREVEVDSRRVMKNLSSMSRLRFLSFQGISTIQNFSRSACKLSRLIILDLRGCYNLEQLPNDIDKLKNLVYLDMTGCDALESIPMRLTRLSRLEVLKGFVVSDDSEIACKLTTLKRLVKLRKLSLTIDRGDFGLHELIVAIESFNALERLKVRWGSGFSLSKKQQENDAGRTIEKQEGVDESDSRSLKHYLPKNLKKLDLQRFPDSELPDCLQPENMVSLEKLHLGSSRRLKNFGGSLPEKPTECSVKVLRLTCLQKLKVEWRELTEIYFPRMEFFENNECPRVTFCPFDRDGIWRRGSRHG